MDEQIRKIRKANIKRKSELYMKSCGCKIVDYELYEQARSSQVFTNFFLYLLFTSIGVGLASLIVIALVLGK